jgi:5-methylcytosine-specific restriction endonuclease McrA
MKHCPVDHRPSEGTYLVPVERDKYADTQSLGGANKRALVMEISERQNHRCAHCGTALTFWWEFEDIIEPWKMMVEDQTRFSLFERKVGRIRNLAILYADELFVVCQECDWHKSRSLYPLTHETFYSLRQDDRRWKCLVNYNAEETEIYLSRQRRKHRARVMRQGELQNHRCCYCGKRMFYSWEKDKKYRKKHLNDLATVEHIVPKSKGGSNHQDNTVIACGGCNVKRGNTNLDVWLKKLETMSSSERKKTPKKIDKKANDGQPKPKHILFAKKLAVTFFLIEQPAHANLTLLNCFLNA